MSSVRAPRVAAAAPLLAAVLAHVAAVAGGFTNWDDPLYLLANPLTVAPLGRGVWELIATPGLDYAAPVTVLGYAAQRALFGLDPMWFHAVSLVMHLGVVALAYALARRLGVSAIAAAAGACLFAVHPLTVEPVAWVVGQKDLWAAGLVLAALLVRAGGDGWARTLVTVVLAVLSLGAKPSAVAVPVLLMALDLAKDRRPLQPRNLLVYVIVGVAAAAATAIAVVGHADLERPATFGWSTIANAGWAASLQLRHVLAPTSLSAAYFAPAGLRYAVLVAAGIALALAWSALAVVLARRGQRVVAFSLAAALIAYAPVSGLVQISRGPADSYLYLPLALLVPAFGLGAEQLWLRSRRPLRAALVLALAVFALVSAARTQVWAGPEPLWADVLEQYPDEPTAMHRYANALQYDGKMDDALAVFERLRERFPEHVASTVDHAFTLDALGQPLRAEAMFALAARLGETPFYHRYYASYVLLHPRLEPSDPELAEAVIAEETPELLARGAPRPVLLRAADLLERGGRHARLVGELHAAARR